MKNSIITFILLICSSYYSKAQISIRTDLEDNNKVQQIQPYDSLSNFALNSDIVSNEYQTKEIALNNITGEFKKYIE